MQEVGGEAKIKVVDAQKDGVFDQRPAHQRHPSNPQKVYWLHPNTQNAESWVQNLDLCQIQINVR